jgi:hypothetical protein
MNRNYFFPIAFLFILTSANVVAQPTISSFSPTSGPIGTTVTITGTNIDPTAANNIVYFGAVKATVNSVNSSSLIVTVPTGTTYKPISVTVNGLTAYTSAPFVVTFTGGGAINHSSFSTKLDFPTGSAPYCAAICDVDGDGKPDLVVTNNNNTFSVFRNTGTNGNVSFAANVDFTTGTSPIGVAIGDVDGDGKPDLVVVNINSNTISVFRNTSTIGSVSFATMVNFTTGSHPSSIVIGDIDDDGKPDLVVTNTNGNITTTNTISIFRNTSTIGNISFAVKVDFTTGGASSIVTIGDVDGDGKPDLALTNNTNTVSIFRNTSTIGSVSFAAKVDFTTGSGPYSVAIGDVDGDGKPDLVVSNANTNTISVIRNTSTIGSISFAAKVDFTTGESPQNIAIGDIDGDGKPDLAVANYDSSTVSVLRNTGTIGSVSFAAKVDIMTGSVSYCVAIGDIDGDGKPDLTVGNYSSNSVSVFRNTISGGNTAPAAPHSLTAVAGNSQVMLNWNKNNETDFLKYRIYMGTDSSSVTLKDSSIVSITDTAKTITGLTNGTTYYFRVSALDSSRIESSKSFAVSATPQSIVTIGPVAYYPFNGNANDESGNGNNGTNNGATLTTDRFGNAGKAYNFDGSSSYISIQNSSSLQITGDITVCAWVKTSTTQSSKGIVEKYYSGNNNDHGWLLDTYTDGGALMEGRDGRGGALTLRSKSSSAFADNQWHSIVGQRSGNIWKVYLDNHLSNFVDVGGTAGSVESGGKMTIGAFSNTTPANGIWTGAIDDIRIYNRALKDKEIDSLYHEDGWDRNNAPSAPKNLTAAAGNGQVALKWNRNTEGDFFKYRVYMGTDSSSMTVKDSSSASITDTTKTITGLTNGTNYYFRISAMDSARLESSQSFAVSATPQSNITSGLVAYYPFNGDANDESGNGNNGTVNGAALTVDRFGNPNNAYSFNGNNSISTNLTPPNIFSVSLWFEKKVNQGNNVGILSTYSTSSYYGLYYGVGGPGDWIRFDNNGINGLVDSILIWQHLVIVSDGTNVKVYQNNIKELDFSGTTTHASTIVFGDSRFNDRYFQGKIDDIRIYNRKLSVSEIGVLYHEGGWDSNSAPAAPKNLTITAGSGYVVLTWNKNIEADFLKYRIYMGTDSVTLALKDSSANSILDTTKIITGLTNGTKYYFRVSALNSVRLESGQSYAVSAIPVAVLTPIISLSASTIVFGSINSGSTLTKSLLITNTGAATLTGTVFVTSNAGYSIDKTSISIAAGAKDSVMITFSPIAAQNYNATLTITHNAAGSPSVVTLSGTGITTPGNPLISLSQSNVLVVSIGNFASTAVGSVIVSNNGTAPLNGTLSYSGSSMLSVSPSTLNITAGSYNTIIVSISSVSIADGTYSGTITITHNASGSPTVIPIEVRKVSIPSTFAASKQFTFVSTSSGSDYKLIGIPGKTSYSASSIFSGSYKLDWRMYRDNGSTSDYLIEYDGSSNFNFGSGKGFWVLSKQSNTFSATLSNYTASAAFPISLQSGWNIISNPYERSVTWNDIQKYNLLSANNTIYRWNNGVWTQSSSMIPYEAYYYINVANAASISIPYDPAGSLSKTANDADSVPYISNRAIQLSLSSDGKNIASVYAGFDSTSCTDYDANDYFAPPTAFAMASMVIENDAPHMPVKRLYVDQRKEVGEGQVFNLVLQNKTNSTVYLDANGMESLPDNEVYLHNMLSNISFNLKQQQQIPVPPSLDDIQYQLVIGSKTYLQKNGVALTPKEYTLYQNYPNPFNPSTTIRISVPARSFVTISVYDILGRNVDVPLHGEQNEGYHEIEWSPKLSSGIYFYRLDAAALDSPGKRFIAVRKMVFMK